VDVAFLTRSAADPARSIEWEDGNTCPETGVGITSAAHPFRTGTLGVVAPTAAGHSPTTEATGRRPDRIRHEESRVMKVRKSLRSLKSMPGAQIVRRRGVAFVINKKNPRYKARQG
jgi:large subunit ribosomal protein L36